MPLLAILVSAIAAGFIVVSTKRPNLRETWTFVAAIAKVGIVVAMIPAVLRDEGPELTLFSIAPDVTLALRVDAMGMIFALSASVLWLLTSVYSVGYMRGLDESHQTRYYASFALCLSATMGLAFAANLFTLFVFYELLTVSTYPLVVHKQTPEALAAGRKYLGYLLAGGAALLLALGITQVAAPGEWFEPGGYLAGEMSQGALRALVLLFVIGFGTKSAVMPLHAWLPAAMVAPTPVSALLHAVAVVNAGLFGFARVFGFVIGTEVLADIGAGIVVATLAAATIVLASIVAFRQDNLKRRLAYSTVAHLSLIVLGVSLISASAWDGALLYFANHAVLKITLFFCAGAIYVRTGIDRVSQMDGIGRQMPLTMAAFGIASLGLAGIPPLGGFVSKWFLGLGSVEANEGVLTVVVIGSGLLTAGYLFPVFLRAFYRPSTRFVHFGEASAFMVVPLVITTAVALALGLSDAFRLGELAAMVAARVTEQLP